MTGWPIALALAAGITAGGGVGWLMWPKDAPEDPPARSSSELMDALMWNREPVGGPFALIDHTGAPRSDTDFRGKLMLIYFGFTFCSDICPIDLQSMAAAVDELGPAGDAVQPLFITVDPDKDTPEQLRGYVGLFHPRLVGLTGDPRAIKRLALAYKVYYARTPGTDTQVDHSGVVYLMDRDGRYAGFFPPGTPAARMVEVLRPMLTPSPRRVNTTVSEISLCDSDHAASGGVVIMPSPLGGEGSRSGSTTQNG